jgi:DNA-binding transcriptional LysR family regulator
MDQLLANGLFCRVVELGSFSAAAREARLPQPSASRMIAALEESLTVRLLERSTRRVVPTLEGRAYYVQIVEAVRVLEQARVSARNGFAELAGEVKIAMPGALGRKLLLPQIATLLLESPELRIDVSASDSDVDFLAGGFDFAIRVAPPKDKSFVARELAQSEQWLVASPNYLSMRGTPRSPAELRDHHLVMRGVPPIALLELGVTTRMVTDEIETAQLCAIAGLGLSLLPRWLVARDVTEGRLIRVPVTLPALRVPIYATYPAGRRLRKAARRVLDRLTLALQQELDDA